MEEDLDEGSSQSNVPVDLTLNVGTVSIELGKLINLQAGVTLTDGVVNYFPKVRAMAGTRAVAEGELVVIGENQVGFRILKLLA